jgi:hypothetical protein
LANPKVQDYFDVEVLFVIFGFYLGIEFSVPRYWFKKGYIEDVSSEPYSFW